MPKSTTQSKLQQRLQQSGVRNETRYKDPVAPGGGSLPAGMSGVAKLTRLDFDLIKEGQKYAGEQRFYCHGVCVEPKEFKDDKGNVHRTEGAMVQLGTIRLCDTDDGNGNASSFEENWQKAENRMKLLGIPTEELDDSNFEESCLSFVNQSELYFRFRTWKPEDRDNVSVILEGPVDYTPSDSDDVVTSSQPETVSSPPQKQETKKETTKTQPAKSQPTKPKNTGVDLMSLGDKGDNGDESCQMELTRIAGEKGIDPTPYDNWTAVAQAIQDADKPAEDTSDDQSSNSPADTSDASEEVEPNQGDIVAYNDVECEVTAVFAKSKKVNVKEATTGKLHKSVPWGDIQLL